MKKINELTWEDQKNLIENNYELKEKLIDSWIDGASLYLDNLLRDIGGCDYEITLYGYSRFEIKEWQKFAYWFNEVQHDYCLVSDEEAETVEKYIRYAEIYDHVDYLNYYGFCKQKDFDRVEELTEKYLAETEDIILEHLEGVYEYDGDCLIGELAWWIECNIEDQDNAHMTDDYKIYEHIPEHIARAYEKQIA